MQCLTCKYDLAHLTPDSGGDYRCPECGRAFDPQDASTYESGKPVLLGGIKYIILACLLFNYIFIFFNAPSSALTFDHVFGSAALALVLLPMTFVPCLVLVGTYSYLRIKHKQRRGE